MRVQPARDEYTYMTHVSIWIDPYRMHIFHSFVNGYSGGWNKISLCHKYVGMIPQNGQCDSNYALPRRINAVLLACISLELVYLGMLFILQVACIVSSSGVPGDGPKGLKANF